MVDWSTYIEPAFRFYRKGRSLLGQPKNQRIAWAVALIVFLGGLSISIVTQPDLFSDLQFGPIAFVLGVLSPLMVAVNVAAIVETAKLSGTKLSAYAALRITVMSAAANHLPVPGGAILRVVAFREAGASLKAAGLSNITAGLLWMAATFLFAGVFAFSISFGFAFLLITAGIVCAGGAVVLSRGLSRNLYYCTRLFVVSLLSALFYSCAIYCALLALGVEASFSQSIIIAISGVIGAAISLTPSGLGVREATAAGLAAMIGVAPGAAFTAVAIAYLSMLTLMGGFAAFFAGTRKATTE